MSGGTIGQERLASPRRGLRSLLAATATSMIGQGVALAAMPLLAASVTSDPLGVSLATTATYAASLLVGLPAGAWADRWPYRSTMIGADAARAVILAALSLAVLGSFTSIPLITVTAFALASAGCFFDPSAQATIPLLVGRDPRELGRANGALWTLDTVGRALVGPPLGALLFSVAAVAPFALNAATFVVSAALLLAVPRTPARPPASRSLWAEMREGIRFVGRDRRLRWLAVGMGSYNFGYNVAYSTLVLFAQIRLGLSSTGFGILLAFLAVGGVIGGLVARRAHQQVAPWRLYAWGLAGQAAGWGLVVATSSVVIAAAGLVVVGVVSTVLSVIGGTARQLATPEGMIGRTTAATRTIGIGAAAIGAAAGGLLGRGGITLPVIGAAILLAAGAVIFAALGRRG